MKGRKKTNRYAAMVLCLLLAFAMMLAGCGGSGGSGGDSDEPDPAKYGEETFAGTTWIGSDGSELVFGEDGTLSWYREEGVHDGDVFAGPYVVHRGQAAYDFVVNDLAEYGVTEEELDRVLSSGDADRELDDLVVYTLDHQRVIMDGEPVKFDDPVVAYYGFMINDGEAMDIANMRNATTYYFTKK